jgi:GT2 family glycosyltransferase
MKPRVSIITIHRNNLPYLEKYAKALKENTTYSNFEVILIDNASVPSIAKDIFAIVDSMGSTHVTVYLNKEMQSFAANCNFGASKASGELLCFLNDDTEPQKGWLTEMVKTLQRYDECEIVGAKMWFPNQMIQHAGIAFHQNKMPGHVWWNQIHKDDERLEKEQEFNAVTGGCMLISSSFFKKMGCFDTKFERAGYEDIDLCLRVGAIGKKIYYSPKAGLIHHEKVTQNKFDPKTRQEYHVKNTQLFLDRWADKIVPDYSKYEPGVA